MSKITDHYREELYASPYWIVIALVALGLSLGFYISTHSELPYTAKLLVVYLFCIAGLGWTFSRLSERGSGLFMTISMSVIIYFTQAWFRVPGTLTLLFIPIWLAMALAGWQAALGLALINTLAILGLFRQGGLSTGRAEIWLSIFTIWAAAGSVVSIYASIQRLAQWTWDYYENARLHLDEALDRQVQLSQALDDLVHANRQLTLFNDRIRNFRQAAEDARRSKEMFVARVSHEFRAPLNVIIGMVSLMVDSAQAYETPLPARAMQHLDVINRSCRHLASMIDDVLDLSQAEEGRMILHREMVNLVELIDSALAIVHPLIENKGLELKVHYPEQVPSVYCDRLRIRQVILNLLSNAARYTEKGSVTVDTSLAGNQILIEIRDTGPGIAPEDTERIFEPFSSVGKEVRRMLGGSGLGLSISKQFVELHNGTIKLESKLGEGSTFSVRLPLIEPGVPAARPGQWISDEWIWIERKPGKERPEMVIKPRLIVCDETGFLHSALVHSGGDWELIDTRELDQALAELNKAPADSLVLNLPHLGGLDRIMERLRREAQETPVICCTFPRRISDAQQAGAVGYILKPLTSMALDRTLDSFDRDFHKILVVDDDEDTRGMMGELIHLYESNIQVLFAEDGEAALSMLRDHSPDLMLLDVVMPEMSGWEVLALKQKDPDLESIPVIMVSADDLQKGPFTTPFILASIGDGISIGKLSDCLSFFPKLMLQTG